MSAPPGTQFTPLTTFRATVAGRPNTYLEGFSYTVREGDEDLARLVPEWINQGKVELLRRESAQISLSGKARTGGGK